MRHTEQSERVSNGTWYTVCLLHDSIQSNETCQEIVNVKTTIHLPVEEMRP